MTNRKFKQTLQVVGYSYKDYLNLYINVTGEISLTMLQLVHVCSRASCVLNTLLDQALIVNTDYVLEVSQMRDALLKWEKENLV